MATKSAPRLAKTAANNDAIVSRIEAKLGPVGKGHHNSHRTANILEWLRSKEKKGGSTVNSERAKAFSKQAKGGK